MDSMKEHLICSGCNKKCDGGKTDRDNSYTFESKKYGAYVFGKNGKRVDEWYCEECNFELLCGDCGSPHELETALYSKPEYEDFYLCFSCEIQREDNEHEEKHNGEPNLDCGGCQGGTERGEVKIEALNIKK